MVWGDLRQFFLSSCLTIPGWGKESGWDGSLGYGGCGEKVASAKCLHIVCVFRKFTDSVSKITQVFDMSSLGYGEYLPFLLFLWWLLDKR